MLQFLKMAEQNVTNLAKKSLPVAEKYQVTQNI